jgi:hypothetical protein
MGLQVNDYAQLAVPPPALRHVSLYIYVLQRALNIQWREIAIIAKSSWCKLESHNQASSGSSRDGL